MTLTPPGVSTNKDGKNGEGACWLQAHFALGKLSTETLFSSSATPTVTDANAGGPLELGMKFTADQNGFASGVRFYKGATNLGTHIGSLWTAAGQLLAQVTFTGETASGWQQANFSPPVAINANTVYVISYHSTGVFSYTLNYFTSPVDNPPLHAVIGNNGVYSLGPPVCFRWALRDRQISGWTWCSPRTRRQRR